MKTHSAIAAIVLLGLGSCCMGGDPYDDIQNQRMGLIEERLLEIEKSLVNHESWIRFNKEGRTRGSGDEPYPIQVIPPGIKAAPLKPTRPGNRPIWVEPRSHQRKPDFYDPAVASTTRTTNTTDTGPELAPPPPLETILPPEKDTKPRVRRIEPIPEPELGRVPANHVPGKTYSVRVGTRYTYVWSYGPVQGPFGVYFGWSWRCWRTPVYRDMSAPRHLYFPRRP